MGGYRMDGTFAGKARCTCLLVPRLPLAVATIKRVGPR